MGSAAALHLTLAPALLLSLLRPARPLLLEAFDHPHLCLAVFSAALALLAETAALGGQAKELGHTLARDGAVGDDGDDEDDEHHR